MSIRYYIICRGLYPESAPWVLAETVDGAYARDEANTWSTTLVLPREEALADPRFRGAVQAWERGDDAHYEHDMAVEDAEVALDEAAGMVNGSWTAGATGERLRLSVLSLDEFVDATGSGHRPEHEILAAYRDYVILERAWGCAAESAGSGGEAAGPKE